MLRLIPPFIWIALVLTSSGCTSSAAKIDVGQLLTSGRDGWQHPARVIDVLEIEPGDVVAEIGAGSGYWLARLSDAVGPTGHVYAVEVEADLVADLAKWVNVESYDNISVILGDYHDPRLPDGEIDLALTCLTYHHIQDRVTYFGALKSDLSDGGRVVHLDDRPDSPAPISWFQTDGHWSDPVVVTNEMTAAGYSRKASYEFLPSQSFQIFAPAADTLPAISATTSGNEGP